MNFINTSSPVKIRLSKNLIRTIKRGHAWVYDEALQKVPNVTPGTPAILFDKQGKKQIALGYLDPNNPIAFRVCTTNPNQSLNSSLIEQRLKQALDMRNLLFDSSQTNAYRLINGAGDQLPGLTCDRYDQHAVITTDGEGADNFWQIEQIASWLGEKLKVKSVYKKSRDTNAAVCIWGKSSPQPVAFIENDINFTADLVSGQKTGFFLDQRENRQSITPLSKDKTVLNAFGYTGGFSIYAGKGGAKHVTTLDIAQPALEAAQSHWEINQLPINNHAIVQADAFDYLENAVKDKKTWDIVILDPPSFAPSETAVPQATNAYTKLITLGAKTTAPQGILAAASCSSHITEEMFLQIIEESISNARRKAVILKISGQPADHPFPLAMPELRYLKFVLMQLD